MTQSKRIAVLTSGGDAPGMNAAIRSVVRRATQHGWEVFGVENGYRGLIDGNFVRLGMRDVGNIIQLGGTMLGSARAPEFKNPEGQQEAIRRLHQQGIDALVVIGGNGSQTGAYALSTQGFDVVGVASTIDNDLYGSEITIGVDTALNVALESIDRLRTTASSHHRAFIVEVMGRDCGYLGMMAGLAGGALAVQIPEMETTPEAITNLLVEAYERGKKQSIIVVAEGCQHDVDELAAYYKDHRAEIGFPLRVTRLGHVQRGGVPTAADRLLATRLAAGAVDALQRGESGVLCGLHNNQITLTPYDIVVNNKKTLDLSLLDLARDLAM